MWARADNTWKGLATGMEKTYRLLDHLDHTEPLPIEEIEGLYQGYWVYIVKAKVGEYGKILSGVPVVIGSRASDGAFDGIYEKYNSDEYDIRADLNLLPNRGFISSLKIVSNYDE